MKITEFLHHVEIEKESMGASHFTRMAIPKNVLTAMRPQFASDEPENIQVDDPAISYLFVPESGGCGGCGCGPGLGPTLVAEADNGDRLFIEMTYPELASLEAVVANFEHIP